MKPEIILQSSLLDILFNGRNQDYGAYILRTQYNQRLSKAMAITFSVALFFSISWYVQANFFNEPKSLAAGMPTTGVILQPINDKPKPIEKTKTNPKHNIKQVANPSFQIVPDNKFDKPLPKKDELENAIIGLVNTDGKLDSGFIVPPSGPITDGIVSTTVDTKKEIKYDEPLTFAEKMPEFPGGEQALINFMLRNLREADDLESGEKIVIRARFVVEASGDIGKVEILSSSNRYDNEVARVINKMPAWKPGSQNGIAVPVYFTLPVTFQGREE